MDIKVWRREMVNDDGMWYGEVFYTEKRDGVSEAAVEHLAGHSLYKSGPMHSQTHWFAIGEPDWFAIEGVIVAPPEDAELFVVEMDYVVWRWSNLDRISTNVIPHHTSDEEMQEFLFPSWDEEGTGRVIVAQFPIPEPFQIPEKAENELYTIDEQARLRVRLDAFWTQHPQLKKWMSREITLGYMDKNSEFEDAVHNVCVWVGVDDPAFVVLADH